MKNIINKSLELFVKKYEFEITVSMLFFSPAIFSVIFYLLKTYVFVNPNYLVGLFLNLGFSTCYYFAYFFSHSVILILISSLICRIGLIISEKTNRNK
ncbi:hypothetical protein OX90_11295 [Pseudomonas coronafaciens pv. porri]|uniref:Uncharacterized protein n=1 Tax=Pseudomonas coronafaciens pv. porri TaxID=83964 RepID=A0ABR5JQN9_9PSED|nr:hypothetical protein OX90_11295 [Pseudomonas coronafaciens pv. porri]